MKSPRASRRPNREPAEIYKAIFDPQDEGGYTVTVPSLPGCISEGNTFEEAFANIKEAMALYLESLAADRRPIPRETRLVVEIESPSGQTTRR
ncbi:MAG: type II toxin-antitoxin system HicB family antitoxin [Planctomycetes bacterium]|nr:type II toxin-antitoxin system HicB family antitoxin [Planctomycetota bacterium]